MILMIENVGELFGNADEIRKLLEAKDSDSDDECCEIWETMTQKKIFEEQPPLPFLLIADFFKKRRRFYRL